MDRPNPAHYPLPWRDDAEALRLEGFPLCGWYNIEAPKYEAKGETLRTPEDILARFAICETCEQFDQRKCKLCRGCSGQGEKAFLFQLSTVGGKCLLKEKPLWGDVISSSPSPAE